MKVCLECGSIFNRFGELKEGVICPTLFCSGIVTEIDDAILHVILLLNQKGYRTTHCCSGHTWGNDPFIVFDKIVHPGTFLSLPKDFSSGIIYGGALRISKSIPQKSPVKRQRELMKASVDLISWADKLSPTHYIEADFIVNNSISETDFIKDVDRFLHLDLVKYAGMNDEQGRVHFHKLIDPLAFKKLGEDIKSFANKKGVEVSIAIYE